MIQEVWNQSIKKSLLYHHHHHLAIYKIGPKKFVTKKNTGTTLRHPNLTRDYKILPSSEKLGMLTLQHHVSCILARNIFSYFLSILLYTIYTQGYTKSFFPLDK